ncbi:glycosyltransferase [Longilinea arvoryzae]|uniref:Glycosyltransferase n=1 Tax=Longilinea arvoryzae TaxID=360412 RepID=A0A0S7B7P3_9CHLR|nr:glycosyltransferase family 4 protein [Longilinea arvoryzae]GAP13407.1 glycosyltransferase [Longilinea arvoryzae]
MSAASTQPVRICILPQLQGVGGPVSFRARLTAGLTARGVSLADDPRDPTLDAVLMIGGTSRITDLLAAKHNGVRIVQRLNGMNWIHRKRYTGVKHFLKSEWNNRLLALIRERIADHVVYQSHFARDWWQTVRGATRASHEVIYNGVDLNLFTPDGPEKPPRDFVRLLLVEAHLGGGNEPGLENALALAALLARRVPQPVELMVAGEVPSGLRASLHLPTGVRLNWAGVVRRDQVAQLDRLAHLLFSADLNAACPNSVIEALACGLPVVSFATGSLPELLEGGAGQVAPYGSNYWNLEPPVVEPLAEAAIDVLRDQEHYRPAARARAEALFGLDTMTEKYLKALVG